MSEVMRVVSATGVIDYGDLKVMVTKEALDSMVPQAVGDRAVPLMVAHDPFCLPIGKIQEVMIEPRGEEYVAIARIYIEDSPSKLINSLTGAELVCLDFDDDRRPFVGGRFGKGQADRDTLSVDPANFDHSSDYTAFKDDVESIDDSIVCSSLLMRHSIDPVPLVQYVVSNPVIQMALAILAYEGVRYVQYRADEIVRKNADRVFDALIDRLRSAMRAHDKHQSQRSASSVLQMVVPNEIELILLARMKQNQDLPAVRLGDIVEELSKYGDLLSKADSITLALSEENQWEFQYMRTTDGKILASNECYDRTSHTLQETLQGDGSATAEDDSEQSR